MFNEKALSKTLKATNFNTPLRLSTTFLAKTYCGKKDLLLDFHNFHSGTIPHC